MTLIKNILRPIRNNTRNFLNYHIFSNYSQCGEDKLLAKLINKKNGFYVDVGANDPIKLNNTYKFYKMGWKGINIDPIRKNIKELNRIRPRDINLEIGINDIKGEMELYVFDNTALSTFSSDLAKSWEKDGFKIDEVIKVKLVRLEDVFKKYKCNQIDLLSIDAEGFDLQVLKSNNWNKFKPNFICLETGDLKSKSGQKNRKEFINFLNPLGYEIIGDTGMNVVFKLIDNSIQ